MFLKDARAAIVVYVVREGVHDVAQTLDEDRVRHASLERHLEYDEVGGEGVLVHGVDGGKVGEDKEEDGSSLGRWSVAVSHLLYLCSRLCTQL